MFGFLNVYKPAGITSHDVVARLRRVTKIKQIGHTGTLDPFAEGVLPVCIGKATRLIEYLEDEKAYIGTVQLGSSTTTYDTEGEGVKFSDKIVTKEEIETALEEFRGDIEQLPPIYSAIKVQGKKLYEYAREGKEVKIEPRGVNVSKLEIVDYKPELRQLSLRIECSKGTYIRSIANDLGEKLGTYGHLSKLVRVQAGDFALNEAVKLDDLDSIESVQNNLIYPLEKLSYPKYELDDLEFEKVSHGMAINYTGAAQGIIILTKKQSIAAIAKHLDGVLKCEKVFL